MTDIEIPEGFTRWDGDGFFEIELLHRDGSITETMTPSNDPWAWIWAKRGKESPSDIIAYRIVSDA